MKAFAILSLMLFPLANVASAAITVSFDELSNFTSIAPAGSYYNGDSGVGSNSNGWISGGTFFNNSYTLDPQFGGFWSGWSYSNINDRTTAGFTNQYASAIGTGVGGVGNYAVANGDGAYFNLPTDGRIESLSLSNTTYAYLAMRNGDQFTTPFGGLDGNAPDFLKVTFNGFSALGGTGSNTGSAEFYLADFRNSNNALDYIVNDWRVVDLSGLGNARSVSLTFEGSDVGVFGLNTPAYAAFDNITLTAVPEPSSLALLSCMVIGLTLGRTQRKRVGAAALPAALPID